MPTDELFDDPFDELFDEWPDEELLLWLSFDSPLEEELASGSSLESTLLFSETASQSSPSQGTEP